MKTLLLYLALCAAASAQSGGPWSITSSTLDGGGSRATGGAWTLTGTIGQPDATPAVFTGGPWTGSGGFWPGISALPNGPALLLTPTAGNQLRVAWTAESAGYKLQYSSNLTAWTDHPAAITGASFIQFPLSNGPRYFFRLKKL